MLIAKMRHNIVATYSTLEFLEMLETREMGMLCTHAARILSVRHILLETLKTGDPMKHIART